LTSRQRRLSPPICPHTKGLMWTGHESFVRKENEKYEGNIEHAIVLAMYVDGQRMSSRGRALEVKSFRLNRFSRGQTFRGLTPQRTPQHGGTPQTNCKRDKGQDFCSRRFGHRAVRSQMPKNCASRALWPPTALWPNLLPVTQCLSKLFVLCRDVSGVGHRWSTPK